MPHSIMTLTFLAGGLLAVAPTFAADELPIPDGIVLVMADDQGYGDVGRLTPGLQTPVMDELADTGFRFDRFYAAAPVCSPTRCSVLTGRHPNRSGCFSWGFPLRPQEVTVAEIFQQAGWATGHFGKWHLGPVSADHPGNPGNHGFDTWVSAPNFFENDPILSDNGRPVQCRGESSAVTMNYAMEFIRSQVAAGKPFLAVVWFGSPHRPHEATAELAGLYPDSEPAVRNFRAEVTGMDRALGSLRTNLEELGVSENTLVWYTSDNGALPVGSTGGHRGRKGDVFEGGLRVPAMLEWPKGVTKAGHTGARCNSSDILPTLVELARIDWTPPHELDGMSLVPLLRGQLPDAPRAMGFWEYQNRGIGTPSARIMAAMLRKHQAGTPDATDPDDDVRLGDDPALIAREYPVDQFPGDAAWIDGDWKLVKIGLAAKAANRGTMLFNLADDAGEQQDLAARYPDRVRSMGKFLRTWQRSVVGSLNGRDYSKE